MALDTKTKRGSAMGMTLPYRPWLTEPDGTLAVDDRVALLKLAASIAPAAATLVNVRRFALRARRRAFEVETRA